MQFTTSLAVLFAASAHLVSAANINVKNQCKFDVFVSHGSPSGNDAPVRIAAKTGQFSQPIGTTSGQLLKFDSNANEANPIQFNWTPGMDGNTYVGIAEVGSSPLVAYNNSFVPQGSGLPQNCYAVKCAAKNDSCYHSAGGPTCPSSVNWQVTLCA